MIMSSSSNSGDRHKSARVLPSGAEKRKRSKEEAERQKELLSKTRRLTHFFVTGTGSSQASHGADDSVVRVEEASVQLEAQHSPIVMNKLESDQQQQHDNESDSDPSDPSAVPPKSRTSAEAEDNDTIDIDDITLWPEHLTND